jgi:hypothetical protein
LRQWRREAAEAAGFPAFRIFSNATLERLAATRPSSLGQLLLIKGIGPITVQNYGDQLLAILARHPAPKPAAPSPVARETIPADTSGPGLDKPSPDLFASPRPERPPQGEDRAPDAIGESLEGWAQPVTRHAPDRSATTEEPAATEALPTPGAASQLPGLPAAGPALRALLPAAALAFEKRKTKPAFYWTWRLLWDGYSAAQCTEIRQVDPAAVLTHALQAQEQGLPVRLAWFLTADQQQALAERVGDSTPDRLRPLLEQLPPGLGHDHVQLYLRCRSARA